MCACNGCNSGDCELACNPGTWECQPCCYDSVVFDILNSNSETSKIKDTIIKERLLQIYNLVHLPKGIDFLTLTNTPTEEAYLTFFKKFESSTLNLRELRNLLQNMKSSFAFNNNLSASLLAKALLLKKLNPEKMLEISDNIINQETNECLVNMTLNFILLAIYGSETMSYNYNELFNLLFNYVLLSQSSYRLVIPNHICNQIKQNYAKY